MQERVLSLEGLRVRLPVHEGYLNAVERVDLHLHRGETLCLVGESGSGKSVTALSLLRLLDQAEYGEESKIMLNAEDLLSLPEIRMQKIRGKKIAIIFQEPMTSLNPVLSIGQQLKEVATRGLEQILNLLSDVGIGDPEHVYQAYPHQLSGGMRQRVMIAMALAAEPDVLVADEPTTALDVTIQAQVINLIQALGRQHKMGIIFITHDLSLVSSIADTVAVMHAGKIVEQASREAFFTQPHHPYSQRLLACLPDQLQPLPPIQALSSEPILEVKDLSVSYPIKRGLFKRTVGYIHAVNQVSFNLYPGQTLALVGESGCGKTSTAFALLRLMNEAQGEILFQGQNLLKLSQKQLRPMRRSIQMIFQDPLGSLNPRMTVRDILSEGWDAQGLHLNPETREAELDHLIEGVGLPDNSLDRYPHEFSGGQHQRIAIARAIAMQTQIIVCDEPTSALDVTVQAQILQLLHSLQVQQKLTYLFISHNIPVVSYLAHQVAVMYLGVIVEYGTVKEIMETPKHPYTQALLAAVPKLSPQGQALVSPKGEIPSPAHPPSGCHFHPRCPYAMPQCKITYPKKTTLSKTHQVRCYLYEEPPHEKN